LLVNFASASGLPFACRLHFRGDESGEADVSVPTSTMNTEFVNTQSIDHRFFRLENSFLLRDANFFVLEFFLG